MEGRSSVAKSEVLLEKIRGLTRSFVQDICSNRLPMVFLERHRNYCTNSTGDCCCSHVSVMGKEMLSLRTEAHAYRLGCMIKVLEIIQKLLQENKHGSKRDIYYMHPALFSEQSIVDRAINDICILLQCSRHNLNVVSTGKGLIMGWLRFEADRKYDCIRSPSTVYSIPVYVEEVRNIVSVAQYILVIEKETVFQRLANDEYCERNQCIAITGRGYPDVSTRRFLRLLMEELSLPIYGLVDCDPYGLDILMTYRFGSMQMAYDVKFLSVPEIRWLGVFPSDRHKCHLTRKCLLPLSSEDRKKAEAMLQRCYLYREAPRWRIELESLIQSGLKFEIEALSVSSFSFLSEVYIPSRIKDGLYI